MSWDNSLNTGKGRRFQDQAAELLGHHFGVNFRKNAEIPIGKPPKTHKFDLATSDLHYVGECKNYSWTEGKNVPSAKMGFVNEAVFYLTFLSPETVRFVAMRRDIHPATHENLAEYYYRTYHHLLGNVFIIEVDIESGEIKEIGRALG